MTLAEFFDDVETGVTDAGVFFAKIAGALGNIFGSDPLATSLAQALTLLQQDASKVEIMVDGVAQSLVMTQPVFEQVFSYLGEYVKKFDGTWGGMTTGQKIEAAVAELAKISIPLLLSVVPGGGAILTLGETTLEKLVPILL